MVEKGSPHNEMILFNKYYLSKQVLEFYIRQIPLPSQIPGRSYWLSVRHAQRHNLQIAPNRRSLRDVLLLFDLSMLCTY